MKTSVLTFAIIACLASPSTGQPVPNLLRWRVTSAADDSISVDPRTVRLFQVDESLVLAFTFFNQSPSELVISGEQFRERARIRVVVGGREVPVDAQWADVVRMARASSGVSAAVIEVPPGQGFAWNVTITREEREPFNAGSYEVEFDLTAVKSAVTTRTGEPFSGYVVPRNTLTLTIAEPAGDAEHAQRLQTLAQKALLEQRTTEAEGLCLKALALKPDDADLLQLLGSVYVMQARYREAVVMFERVLPRAQGRTSLLGLLALAYAGTGDETNAVRVLKSEGRSDAQVAEELARLRDVVKRRAAPK